MEKQTGLPKNIRQIGEIDRERKICLEDYVMTCIRKKEGQESFLGVFFGEKREEEGEICISGGSWRRRERTGRNCRRESKSRKKSIFRTGRRWDAV